MKKFIPCINRNACTEDGMSCHACGRSHAEINEARELTSRVAEFLLRMDYENPHEFLDYLQRKVEKKIQHHINSKIPPGRRPD